VLDAGLPSDWRDFSSALSRLGHTPADIDAVLITHHHRDHAGNAEQLRSLGARVFSHPADAPYLRGERRLSNKGMVRFLWHPWYLTYMLRLVTKGVTRVPAVAQLDQIADGEILDVPGSPRVVHAPGHTAGSCALFLEDRSLLFSGDALVTLDMTRGRTGPQIIRGPHTETLTWRCSHSMPSPSRTPRRSCPATGSPGRMESRARWTSRNGPPRQRRSASCRVGRS
jgi:glyoxylase-like metal-dependent hydrolase (beta-lactamase superfamily II)